MHKIRRWLRRKWRRLLYLAAQKLMRTAGIARARPLGAFIGDLQFRLAWFARQRQVRDIALLLGRPANDPSVSALLHEAYRVNTTAVLEMLAMLVQRQDERLLATQCEVEGLEHLRAALADGRGVILMGGHMGNHLLLAMWLSRAGFPLSLIYRQSRMMDRGLYGAGLASYGIEAIPANKGRRAYSAMIDSLRRGRIVCVTMDQGTSVRQSGVVVRFLGKDLPMPAGPAQLARRSGVSVVMVAATAWEPVWRFRIDAPLPQIDGATLEADVATLARATERLVLRYPHLWSWQQRRWRKYPYASAAANVAAR